MEDLKRQIRRWVLSSMDLDQALERVNYVLEHRLYRETTEVDRIVSRALQTAMIVAYSRPFSGNRDQEHNTWRLDEFLEVYNEQELAFHSRLLRNRNQVYAHSDSEIRDLRIHVMNIGGVPMVLPMSRNPYVSMCETELERFREMVQKLRARISEETITAQNQLSPGDEF